MSSDVTRRGTWAFLALALSASSAVALAQEATLEYRVKAAYLYKVAPFVAWPASSLGAAGIPAPLKRLEARKHIKAHVCGQRRDRAGEVDQPLGILTKVEHVGFFSGQVHAPINGSPDIRSEALDVPHLRKGVLRQNS